MVESSTVMALVKKHSSKFILRLHCHWKQSQSGTVLKIALCWPLAGSVYTAIIKAIQVLSILYLKGGTSGTATRDTDSSWRLILWSLLLSAKEMHRKAQKHTESQQKNSLMIR